MGSLDTLRIRWDEYEPNIKSGFSQLRTDEDFYDVTLASGENQVKAHKVILGACSTFFKSLLKSVPHQHPLLYLGGVDFKHLESVVNFMYHGEVQVKPNELDAFLAVAQELKVNGLMHHQQSATKGNEEMRGTLRESSPELIERIGSPLSIEDDIKIEDDFQAESSRNSVPEEDMFTFGQNPSIQKAEVGEEEYSTFAHLSKDKLKKVNAILNARCCEFISPRDVNKNFNCLKCDFVSTKKHDVVRHVEARHFKSNGFPCDMCGGLYKTRNSLKMHKIRAHRKEPEFISTEYISIQDEFMSHNSADNSFQYLK